jgi:molybdenum cofactor synthesis domain-containing protein
VIPLEQVRDTVLGRVVPLDVVEVPIREALGLVLAEQVAAPDPVPPFPNTAMDGYAVRAADTAGATAEAPVRLRVVGDLPAGHAPTVPVGPGDAIRIMTGAPMPDGADAIVIVELTERDGADGVLVQRASEPGQHVRAAGGDVRAGDVVFEPGTVLRPAHIGVLATVDAQTVRVHRRALVGVLSTGDELVESGPLAPGKIRDSNRPMLLSMLAQAGAEPVDLGSARDDEDLMTATLDAAISRCDAVLTSGGVSVGDYDYMSAALERIASADPSGESLVEWYQVAIKPAKPLCIATVRGTPVFGLPGNPVSSMVSFELFARPALRAMMGHADPYRPEVVARVDGGLGRRRDGKVHFDRVRVRLDGGRYVVEGVRNQESNALASSAMAEGLAILPDGDGLADGDDVTVMLIG